MTENKSTSLSFKIDSEVIELLKQNQLSIDDLFVLLALDEMKIDLLNTYDRENRDEKVILSYQRLQRRGFLNEDESTSTIIYTLTEFAKELVRKYRGGDSPRKIAVKAPSKSKYSHLSLDEQFKILWEAYPSTSKNDRFPSKHYRVLRDSSSKAKDALRKVLAEGKYNLDDILTGLTHEVEVRKSNRKQNDFEYMSAITAWLNQQRFVSWLEDAKENQLKAGDANPFETIV